MAMWLAMACPAVATELHFSPAENLKAIDVRTIGAARHSIDVAAYVLTDPAVITALADAADRGVKVRLYRDAGQHEAFGVVAAALDRLFANPGVSVQYKGSNVLIHLIVLKNSDLGADHNLRGAGPTFWSSMRSTL